MYRYHPNARQVNPNHANHANHPNHANSFHPAQHQGYPHQVNHPQQQHGYYQQQNFQGPYRKITIEEAMQIALQRVPGEVVKVELETEQGRLVYEVEIMTANGVKYEIDVDANSGTIVGLKPD
ncbi:hypothetical protein DX933_07095 [Ornithinibacillus gellani]|uniref:PepSY domain-containing protein n=1 Tax=Ornithinibacillus gellani TaxID=2293253 RepID=UPI000F49F544|nr:PepSY domain-containing protein [Ornithinibacillus gellani]TQS75291.1 hypothetical protein DX933_07095 [Ornithinibacillus gellani]